MSWCTELERLFTTQYYFASKFRWAENDVCLHAINQDRLIKYWVVYCCKRKRKTPNSFDVDLIWLGPKSPSFPSNYCNINYTVHKHSYWVIQTFFLSSFLLQSMCNFMVQNLNMAQKSFSWVIHDPWPVRWEEMALRRAKTGCERMKEMSCAGWSKASGYNGFTGCDSPLVKCLTISGDTSHKMQWMRKRSFIVASEMFLIRLFQTCINGTECLKE